MHQCRLTDNPCFRGVPVGLLHWSVLTIRGQKRRPFCKRPYHPWQESEGPGSGHHLRPREAEMGTVLYVIISKWCAWGWALFFLPKAFGKLENHSVMLIVTAWDLCQIAAVPVLWGTLPFKLQNVFFYNNEQLYQHKNASEGSQENGIGSFPQAVFCLLRAPQPPLARVIKKWLDFP